MKDLIQNNIPLRKKFSLCLIEDDAEIGNWMVDKLTVNENITSFNWTKNLKDSETCIKKEKPEVIILDLKLPDGNGIDILRMIKSEKLDTKVFVFSSNMAFKNACLRLGAAGFFDKSTDGEALLDSLQRLSA